jgi:hypothetical protein
MIISEGAYLEHYGVKGMHWGIRKSHAQTGMTRREGAKYDKNLRKIDKRAKQLAGLKHKQIWYTYYGKLRIVNKHWQRNAKVKIKELTAQNERIKAGKTTLDDRLEIMAYTNVFDMMVSNRPPSMEPIKYEKQKYVPRASRRR